ncbi:MAG: hypothetical protein J5824_01695 [Lachnospiraceae bacterium]|nr:hypothetical protein [Lachnospiraceae bacterium]
MRILYLHGIGSGADARTARVLRAAFPEAEVLAPELPVSPKAAVEFIRKEFWDDEYIDLVVGTSLGGFYALTLHGMRRLLINPAMYADEDIRNGIGLGRQKFFSARSDGATEYEITEEYLAELAEIRRQIYGGRDIMYPDKLDINEVNSVWGAFGTKDDLVSHYDDFCKWLYPGHTITFEDGHRPSEETLKSVIVPYVKEILDTPIPFVFICPFDD